MKRCTNPTCLEVSEQDDNIFCSTCGSPLETYMQGQSQGQYIAPPDPVPYPVADPIAPPQDKGKGKKGVTIVLLICVILLLAAVGFFLALRFGWFDRSDANTGEGGRSSRREPVADEADDGQPGEGTQESGSGGVSPAEREPSSDPDHTSPDEESAPEPDKPLDIEIVQIDSTDFPTVSFYANIMDPDKNVVRDLKIESFEIYELDAAGSLTPAVISELRQVLTTENVSINLVMDKSGSMSDYNRMTQAKNAATSFLNYLSGIRNNFVELTFFDSFVYVPYAFTDNYAALIASINEQVPGGSTALYDAIYSALLTTSAQRGAKCVIVFTDGEENASSYTYNDVVWLAQATGIPVYIVGVGRDIDESTLMELARLTGGAYFSSADSSLEESLQNVYFSIYTMRRELYIIKYRSDNSSKLETLRSIVFSAKPGMGFTGQVSREYVPVPVIDKYFADEYRYKDFILEFSSSRAITAADLNGLSLAELRIARNEIYARHGRMFRDPLLNKWFYSKPWYLALANKYSPADFDAMRSPLSRTESTNIRFIADREAYVLENERIFPLSRTVKLTEYDVSLSRSVLQKGLEEIYSYAGVSFGNRSALNDIELYNVEMIEYAISQPSISY